MENKGCISRLSVIVLLIVLKAEIFLIPIQVGALTVQKDQELQPQSTDVSQIIKQIVDKVIKANPDVIDNNPIYIEQILVELANSISQASNQTNAIEQMRQLNTEITLNPQGDISLSLILLAMEPISDISQSIRLIQQQIDRGGTLGDSIADITLEEVTDMPNANEIIDRIASNVISGLKLANILETVPSIDIKPEINAILKVEPSSLSTEENTPTKMVVSGTLTYINNSGINDEVIPISIGSPGQETPEYQRKARTDDKGIYEVDFDDVRLSKGTYEIAARPLSEYYSNLSASTQFVVESHPLSFNDVFPYLAASGIIIGIVSVIPRWLIRRKERKTLAEYMTKIHLEYNKFSKSKEIEYLNHLGGLRMELIEILKEGKINETQYEMLDKKISDYIDRVSKDIYKFTK